MQKIILIETLPGSTPGFVENLSPYLDGHLFVLSITLASAE